MAGSGLHLLLPPITNKELEFRKYSNFLLSLLERKSLQTTVRTQPFDVTVNSSTNCQLNCPYCETGNGTLQRTRGLMNPSDHRYMIQGISESLFFIRQFGTGETLLNKNFPSIVDQFKDKEIFSIVSTNLSFKFTDRQIDDLLLCGLGIISVSVDGATAENYEKYRVGGDFQLVMSNMRRLVKRKGELDLSYPLIEWRFLVFEHNKHEIPLAREMAEEINCDLLEFHMGSAPAEGDYDVKKSPEIDLSPIISGPAIRNALSVEPPRLHRILRKQKSASSQIEIPVELRYKKCDWHYFGATFFPNGSVSPCCISNHESNDFGVIERNHSFTQLWNNEKYVNARKAFSDNKHTSNEHRKKQHVEDDLICGTCPNAGSMDHQFTAPIRAILRNAPDWVLKILASSPESFFVEVDTYLFNLEIEAIKECGPDVEAEYPNIEKKFKEELLANDSQKINIEFLIRHLRKSSEKETAIESHITVRSKNILHRIRRKLKSFATYRSDVSYYIPDKSLLPATLNGSNIIASDAASQYSVFTSAEQYLDHFIQLWRETPAIRSLDESSLSSIWQYYYQKPERINRAIGILNERGVFRRDRDRSLFAFYLFYCELLLISKQYKIGLDFLYEIKKISKSDLRLNDIIARMQLLQEDDSKVARDMRYGYNPFQDMYCVDPFERLVLNSNGKMASCCAHWTNSTYGSMEDTSFNQLWYSDYAKDFRRAVTSGSFEYCDKLSCPKIRYKELPNRRDIDEGRYLDINNKHQPTRITLSQDATCNLTCPSCRDGKVTTAKKNLTNVEENYLPDILQGEIQDLNIAGFGDPFASPHYRKILKTIHPDTHRIENLHILTNGLMLNEGMWSQFEHLEGFSFLGMGVSIDAATEETYSVLRRGGKWDELRESLTFIAGLRRESRIDHLTFAFVIQTENFLELPAFIEMANQHNVDHIRLIYLHLGGELQSNSKYNEAAIHLESHPRHGEYLDVLKDPAFNRDGIYFM